MSRRSSELTCSLAKVNLVLFLSVLVGTASWAQAPRGKVVATTFDSQALEGNFTGDSATRRARVYLPPSYETSNQRYPVLYYLHGAGGNVNNFFSFNGHSTANRLIADGSMEEMIIVAVDGAGGVIPGTHSWLNSDLNGNYEDYVIQDVVSHIDSNFRTIPERDSRGIFGQSMGGMASSIFAMKHADEFGAAYSLASGFHSFSRLDSFPNLSGDQVVFTDRPNALNELKAIHAPSEFSGFNYGWLMYVWATAISPNLDRPPLLVDYPFDLETLEVIPEIRDKWYSAYDVYLLLEQYADEFASLRGYGLSVGQSDRNLAVNEAFHRELQHKGIEHDYTTFPGGHADNMSVRYETPLTLFSQWLVHYGDFDKSGELDVSDINTLIAEIATGTPDLRVDVTGDQLVNGDDLNVWVKELKKTWIGDANLDGEFNSTDLVDVFKAGAYEQAIGVGWDGGDWTGDRRFNSADFVAAFKDGGYEQGLRDSARAVPEPVPNLLLLLGMFVLTCELRRSLWRRTAMLAVAVSVTCSTANADIYRWDNGELIPGTEGIEPGPGVRFWDLDLTAANLASTNLTGADLSFVRSPTSLAEADLSGANLTNASLLNAPLTNAVLSGAVIAGANLSGPSSSGLTKEQLYSTASYQDKDLRGVRFVGRDLTGWDFRGQNLSKASLRYAILTDSDLRDANIAGAKFQGTLGLTQEQLYSTGSYQNQDLRGISIRNGDLEHWDFSGQDLTGASFDFANLQEAALSGANLSNASLFYANLKGVELANANLFGTNLRGVENFSPVASTKTRNAIMPDGTMNGLELRGGEYLSVSPTVGMVSVSERFEIADDSILEFRAGCFFGCSHGHFAISSDTPVTLGGTLRVYSDPTELTDGGVFHEIIGTSDLFDWPGLLEPGNVFSSIELPAGAWDLSQLYTEGRIINTEYYSDQNGDFDVDGILDTDDVDRLAIAVRAGVDLSYDVDMDGRLDQADHDDWVHDFAGTVFGDANLDGEFNSSDIVTVFRAGKFGIDIAATWQDGDWTGDQRFDSHDLVVAFQDGGYEVGTLDTIALVPEPMSATVFLIGMAIVWRWFRLEGWREPPVQ
ncbi:MAG: pentapeptide repeat-containing protein [Planctomycetales bacterium]|nr:pentapeptide repeat-containing protein [Planctomycetales bacterium]